MTPLSIVLAIDASESVLRDERLEKNAAKHFVRVLLRDQDELDVMQFADSVREIVSFTNQKKVIERGLEDLQRGDATALMTRSIWGRSGFQRLRRRMGGGGC